MSQRGEPAFVTRARLTDPGVAVAARLVFAAPVPAILGGPAELVVLGGRGQGRAHRVLGGSVSVAVSARARCPVVVIRPLREGAPGRSTARVVVGLDGSQLSAPVLEFALRAAAQRGIGLTAVHACFPPGSSGHAGGGAATKETVAGATVATALAACRKRFPAVDVVSRLVDRPAGAAIVAESAGALAVVGSRGRVPCAGALSGSVSQDVLRHATSPVAVVRRTRARCELPQR